MIAPCTYEAQLEALIRNSWLMEILIATREQGLPEWAVGAGVIRNIVWDHLHGYRTPTPIRDVDVAFFDPLDLSRCRDRAVERRLLESLPHFVWDVTNQAGVHLWYQDEFGHVAAPITSIEDGVSRWPETATAVAVRLLADDGLRVLAPCGLTDLFELRLRRNPRQVTYQYFQERITSKQIMSRWPDVRVLHE